MQFDIPRSRLVSQCIPEKRRYSRSRMNSVKMLLLALAFQKFASLKLHRKMIFCLTFALRFSTNLKNSQPANLQRCVALKPEPSLVTAPSLSFGRVEIFYHFYFSSFGNFLIGSFLGTGNLHWFSELISVQNLHLKFGIQDSRERNQYSNRTKNLAGSDSESAVQFLYGPSLKNL